VPLVIGGGVVDLTKLVFGGTDTGASLSGGVTGNVAEENNSIIEELAELTETMLACCTHKAHHKPSLHLPVGDDQLAQSPQALHPALRITVGRFLVDWSVRCTCLFRATFLAELGRVPDEFLEGLIVVLGEN
jgi:hypothetical protein